MISICSSIYRETDTLEAFIRCVFGNASDSSQVEVVIYNDEAYPPTTELLKNLRLEFPNLIHISFPKRDRVNFIRENIDFYRKHGIFGTEIIGDMYKILKGYETGEVDRLWFPPGRGYNEAVKASSGDILIIKIGRAHV